MRDTSGRPGLWLLAALSAVLIWPSSASADVRGGTAQDPQDAVPTLSGPRNVDIRSVGVSYDTNGVMTATVALWDPFTATTMLHPSFLLTVGMDNPSASMNGRCSTYAPGALTFTGSFQPSGGPGTFSVEGFQGRVPLVRTISPDGTTYSFTVSSPHIAGLDYRCAGLAEVYRYDEYGHCWPSLSNCQDILYSYVGDTVPSFFFDGFVPVPPPVVPPAPKAQCDDGIDNDGDGFTDYPLDEQCEGRSDNVEAGPACSDGLDNDKDGKRDLKDPGCRGNANAASEEDPRPVKSTSKVTRLRVSRKCTLDAEVSVLPNLKPKSVFPFRQVHLSVRGLSGRGRNLNVTRSLPLRQHSGYGFKRLKPGRYKVSVSYPGDPWRKSSRSKARTVKVC